MTKENGHSSTLNAVRHPDAIEDRDRLLGRSARFHRDEKGQVMVMTALLALVFVLFWSTLFGVGEALGMKMKLQDVADTQVYTEALWGARTMNWIAYVNKAQVANLIIITQFSIIHSHAKFWFDVSAFLFLISSILAKIPYIGPIFNVLNNTLFAVGAGVVAAYELFAYYLADYGIPAVALMIQALCYWQYAWMGFVFFFPERGDEVIASAEVSWK